MFDQWEVMEQLTAQKIADPQQSLSSESHHSLPSEQQAAVTPPEPKNSLKSRSASSSGILSCGKSDNFAIERGTYGSLVGVVTPKKEMDVLVQYGPKRDFETVFGQQTSNCGVSVAKKPSYNNKEHTIAERKRREKLNQRFIALAAVVPGLKKVHSISPHFILNIHILSVNDFL